MTPQVTLRHAVLGSDGQPMQRAFFGDVIDAEAVEDVEVVTEERIATSRPAGNVPNLYPLEDKSGSDSRHRSSL